MKEKYFSSKFIILTIVLFICLFIFSTPSLALIPGDFGSANNGPPDGVVDFEDLMIFAMAYGSCQGDVNWNPDCDIASPGSLIPDGIIDFEDLMIFAMNYGLCEEPCPPPSAPTLSDPGTTLPSPATYTVSWSAVSGASSYKIQEATSSDFSGAQEYTLSGTSKSFSHTVSTTTTYYYRVAAINDCGQSGWSNGEDITVVIVTGPVHNLTKDAYYNTIQAALDDADSLGGDIIEVADGTYNESITFPTGKLVTLQSASGICDNVIIQGANNLPTVTIDGSSTGTTLRGFTITHTGGNTGRGIYISEGFLIIDNCLISGNTANLYGGGIYNYGTLTITSSSTISGNTATYGGGIYNEGTLTITSSSTIFYNTADYGGGGIHNNGTLTIEEGSTISDNSAANSGGGIYNSDTLTITSSSTISDNTADYGGGIYNEGTLTITSSSTIFYNTAYSGDGGGIYNGYGTLTITSSDISSNTAAYSGGGIYNSGGTLTITSSSTISGNTATYGGGIFNYGTLDITSSTISGNNVISQEGGGIYLEGTGTIIIGGNDASDTSNFNTFTDNKKDGKILADQHIRNSSGDCRSSYPNNNYNPN